MNKVKTDTRFMKNIHDMPMYCFVTEDGLHVNLTHRNTDGNPIEMVYASDSAEPVPVQYYLSVDDAESYRSAMRERYIEHGEEIDALQLTWLERTFIKSGNYEMVQVRY